MDIRKLAILIGFIIICTTASAQKIEATYIGRDTLYTTLLSFGKNPLDYVFTNIKSRYITSALWVTMVDRRKLTVVINDRVFNYAYFHENIYQNMTTGTETPAVIYVDKYTADCKTVYVANQMRLNLAVNNTRDISRQTPAK